MGDHRANIEVRFTMHGKTYKEKWWINYSPADDGIDYRIREWFAECWQDAYQRYESRLAAAYAREHAAETEAQERKELAQLKAKYEESHD